MERFLGKSEKIALGIVISFALVCFILVLVWTVGMKPRQQSPSFSKQKINSGAGQQNLPIKFAGEKTATIQPTSSFSLDIIPADELSALVYRLEIFFDPKALFAEEVIAGDFFKNPQILRKDINNETGRIYFSAGIVPQELEEKGEPKSRSLLARVFFKTKPLVSSQENLETTVSFGKKTMIIGGQTKLENFSHLLEQYKVIIVKES